MIVHFLDSHGHLPINVAYTQRGRQFHSPVMIPIRDLGIDWHVERLPTRAVDLGRRLTQEDAEEQQQSSQSPKLTRVVSHRPTLPMCFRVGEERMETLGIPHALAPGSPKFGGKSQIA